MYVLASQSPRRRELLSLILPKYECTVSGVVETVPFGTPWGEIPVELAKQKASAVSALRPGDTVIGADTVVVSNGDVLGKPKNDADAAAMLKKLSGAKHLVLTGVTIAQNGMLKTFCESTEVEFYPLSDELIAWYVATGEPRDKAGAYGIQGFGCVLVKGITGDYFNVMGLPVSRLARELGVVR